MTVIFFVSNLNSGGIENYLLRFLKYQNKIEPIVVLRSGATGVLESKYRNLNVNIIPLFISYYNPIHLIKVLKLYHKYKPEAVCDFSGGFSLIPIFASYIFCIKKRIIFIRNSHNNNKKYLSLIISKLFLFITSFFSSSILSNSYQGLEFHYKYFNIFKRKQKVIFNGFELSNYSISIEEKNYYRNLYAIPNNCIVIGNVGRVHPLKNHSLIINLAKSLKSYPIYFCLVGEGIVKEFSEIVSSQNLKIILINYTPDVNKLYSFFDIFLFPSISEGQPNALIEAIASGLPILASDIPSIREVVNKEFYTNLFILNKSTHDNYFKVITKILENKDLLSQYKCSTDVLNRFDHRKNFEQFLTELQK